MGRYRRPVAGGTLGIVLAVVLAGAPAGAKLQKACTLLEPAEIQAVVGLPIGEPDPTGSKYGCSFDIGDGIGSPGGGLVVMQYQKGKLAKNLWSDAKNRQEKVGSLSWDPQSAIASGFRRSKLVAASVTITGTPGTAHKDQALALVAAALEKL